MGQERMRLINIMVLEAEKSKVLFRVICFVAARWMDLKFGQKQYEAEEEKVSQ